MLARLSLLFTLLVLVVAANTFAQEPTHTKDALADVKKNVDSGKAVMLDVREQSEWEAMELARPGYHTLVRAGIANEAEAEALARDMSGFVPMLAKARKASSAS